MKGQAALVLLVLAASCGSFALAKLQDAAAKQLLDELKSSDPSPSPTYSTTRATPSVKASTSPTAKRTTSSRSTDSELSSILSIRGKDMLMESTRSGDDEDSNNEKVSTLPTTHFFCNQPSSKGLH